MSFGDDGRWRRAAPDGQWQAFVGEHFATDADRKAVKIAFVEGLRDHMADLRVRVEAQQERLLARLKADLGES
jgi:hypothetical protein